ncbi:MAG: hypothetical protein ACREFZ_10490, partial [Acetobacteraceae bacterium]
MLQLRVVSPGVNPLYSLFARRFTGSWIASRFHSSRIDPGACDLNRRSTMRVAAVAVLAASALLSVGPAALAQENNP